MKSINKLIVIGAMLVASIGVFAQGRGFGRGGFMNNPYMLLSSKDVQTDLKLSDDQNKKITDIQAAQRNEMQEAFQNASAAGGPPDRSVFQKINQKYQDQYKAVLTPDQDKRLHEISLQQQGSMALSDSAVQDQLGLDADQKQKITDLMSQFDDANNQLRQSVRDGSVTQEDAQAERQKNMATLKDKLNAILTPDQQQKFKDMQGAPFTGKIEMPRFGGRRGGGGGGGGGISR